MAGGAFNTDYSDDFDIGFDAAVVAQLSGLFGGAMPAVRQNFNLTRGDDAQVSILVTDGDGAALGVTEDTVITARWTYGRREFGAILGTKTEDDGLEIVANEEGNLYVFVNFASEDFPSDDAVDHLGDYRHELQLTLEGDISTVTKGRFTVRPDMQPPAA